jgi:hypothetical protein
MDRAVEHDLLLHRWDMRGRLGQSNCPETKGKMVIPVPL